MALRQATGELNCIAAAAAAALAAISSEMAKSPFSLAGLLQLTAKSSGIRALSTLNTPSTSKHGVCAAHPDAFLADYSRSISRLEFNLAEPVRRCTALAHIVVARECQQPGRKSFILISWPSSTSAATRRCQPACHEGIQSALARNTKERDGVCPLHGRQGRQLGASRLNVANDLRARVLCRRDDAHGC